MTEKLAELFAAHRCGAVLDHAETAIRVVCGCGWRGAWRPVSESPDGALAEWESHVAAVARETFKPVAYTTGCRYQGGDWELHSVDTITTDLAGARRRAQCRRADAAEYGTESFSDVAVFALHVVPEET